MIRRSYSLVILLILLFIEIVFLARSFFVFLVLLASAFCVVMFSTLLVSLFVCLRLLDFDASIFQLLIFSYAVATDMMMKSNRVKDDIELRAWYLTIFSSYSSSESGK